MGLCFFLASSALFNTPRQRNHGECTLGDRPVGTRNMGGTFCPRESGSWGRTTLGLGTLHSRTWALITAMLHWETSRPQHARPSSPHSCFDSYIRLRDCSRRPTRAHVEEAHWHGDVGRRSLIGRGLGRYYHGNTYLCFCHAPVGRRTWNAHRHLYSQ